MTLVVVCVLAAGLSITPPPGWTIEKIEHKDEVWYMEYTAKAHTRIVFKRDVTEKDMVTLPDGCQGEATVRTAPSGSFKSK